MTLPTPLTMMGAPGSPYTRKMRSVLRYRRIPYRFIQQNSPETAKLPVAKVPLLPTFFLPNEAGEIVPVTDSTPLEDAKDPDDCNVMALIKLFAEPAEVDEIAASYRAGGYGYGHAKSRLAELINDRFAAARERYEQLLGDSDYVRDVLRDGGQKARDTAETTMQRVRDACGILTHY